MKIRVTTDSTADLPVSMAEDFRISVVPYITTFDGVSYREGIDISTTEFYQLLIKGEGNPTTSQPAPKDYEETFRAILKEDPENHVLHLTFPEVLSGGYKSACMAQEIFGKDRVTVIDSKTASLAIGFMAIKAVKAAQKGMNLEEVIALLKEYRETLHIVFIVDTLEYLKRGGRLSTVQAAVGTMMNIKPILTISREGKVVVFDKARGKKQAIRKMLDVIGDYGADFDAQQMAIMHTANEGEAQELKMHLQEQFGTKNFVINQLGAVIGAHVGPGVIGVIFHGKKGSIK